MVKRKTSCVCCLRPLRLAALVAVMFLGVIDHTSSLAAAGRQTSNAVSLEQSAIELLEAGRYNRAASIFADLASQFPSSPKHDAWLYNLGRCKYHLGQYDSAALSFREALERYPQSEYTPYRWFFLGNIAVHKGLATEATKSYVVAYSLSDAQRLSKLSAESIRSLIKQSGDSLSVFERLVEESFPTSGAKHSKAELLAELTGNPTGVRADVGQSDARTATLPTVTLALPLGGKYKQYSKRIERGARLANVISLENKQPVVEIQVEDTEGSPAQAVAIAQQAEAEKALALIGPLTSEEAVAVSAALNCSELPALAPAANQNDFATLSKTMFQLTPSPRTIGRRLAEYAFLQMPVATAAALAQNSPSDKEMATAFAERFTELGGEMVALEIFPPSATDFGAFGEKIKTRFLGAYDEDVTLIGENGDTLDFDEAPVEIGCIFVGATVRQLQLILPQINYHNIRTTLIGSDGLANPRVWDIPLQNVKGIVFTSWRTQDATNTAFRDFAQLYRNRYGESPDRLAALGYDAVRMVIEGLQTGADTPAEMSQYLEDMQSYSGASGKVVFGPDHINRELSLYTVVDKLPQKLSWNPPPMSTSVRP